MSRSERGASGAKVGILIACRLPARGVEHCPRRHAPLVRGPVRMTGGEQLRSRAPIRRDPLGGKARLFLRGSIDLVDDGPMARPRVGLHDGSALGSTRKGLRGGRPAQRALYSMAFDTLLPAGGRGACQSLFFRTTGRGPARGGADRSRRDAERLSRLSTRPSGMFPHAVSRDDCKFCDSKRSRRRGRAARARIRSSTGRRIRARRLPRAAREDL